MMRVLAFLTVVVALIAGPSAATGLTSAAPAAAHEGHGSEPEIAAGTELGFDPFTDPGPDSTVGGPVTSSVGGPSSSAGVGQYGLPEWLPLRTTTGSAGGGPLQMGCTYQSPGFVCGGHHSYWALDLAVQQGGVPVFASGAGVVTVGFQSSGWGSYVVVDHGPFGRTLYAHLGNVVVGNGQWVDQNTRIGSVGQTGSASTPHLHYEYYDLLDAGTDDPGDLKACHGNSLVTYGGWQGLTWGSRWMHSDSTTCGSPPADVPARFHPLEPARVLDSRPGPTNVGPYSTPWGAGARDVQIAGVGGVPGDAEAVVLNVTVVNPTSASFLQLWPTDTPQPTFGSSLNFTAGQIVPNSVTVKIGNWGQVRVFNAAGSTDVVIDVSGYYKAGSDGAGFVPVTPARLLDSRPGWDNIGSYAAPWAAGSAAVRTVPVAGLGGVPANASAVVLNVTAVNPTAHSFLQLWPAGSPQPGSGSSLNVTPGQVVANAVTVKVGSGGTVQVFNAAGTVDVVVDVSGYYTDSGGAAFHAVQPERLLDSRPGSDNVGPFSSPWDHNGARYVQIVGEAAVPSAATAVVMNVTAVQPTAPTFVQLWPADVAKPVVGSNVNAGPGQIVPNAVTVKVGSGGDVLVYNLQGSLHLVADVAGWFG